MTPLSQADGRIAPTPQTLRWDPVAEETVERIHHASLQVLERTGIALMHDQILKRLETEGCIVDHDAKRVRFPRQLIEEAIARAPRNYMLAGRDSACDIALDGTNTFLTLDGCASDVLDPVTDEMRPSTKLDLERATRLADAIPEVTIAWQPCAARDVPTAVQPLHEMEAQFRNTSKHMMQMTVIEAHHARAAVEMAALAAGGEQALRDRPILSGFQCSLSPLVFDGGPVESAIIYAEAGLPSGWVAMPLTAATAPMTVAGTLVLQNAELLAGMALVELLVPGAPTFYGVCTSTMDLNTGSLSLGFGPEEQLFSFASGQLARRYGVPSLLGAFGTGAKTADYQDGAQNAVGWFSSLLAGADMVCATGTIYGGRVFAYEQELLDAELLGITREMAVGIPVDREALAVDVIDAVKPGGHFLDQDHTLAHMRDLWQTALFNRESWEDWEAAGRPEPKHKARERAMQIIDEHEPLPLPEGVEDGIRAIVANHEANVA